jgi:hypothetical protein
MNCLRCRNKLEYLAEESDPRNHKKLFFCKRCQKHIFIYEPESSQIRAFILRNLDFNNTLPSAAKELLDRKNVISKSPLQG